jgi:hypothetical protein
MCNIKNTSSNNPFKLNNKKWTALSVVYNVIKLFENAYYYLLVNDNIIYYTMKKYFTDKNVAGIQWIFR